MQDAAERILSIRRVLDMASVCRWRLSDSLAGWAGGLLEHTRSKQYVNQNGRTILEGREVNYNRLRNITRQANGVFLD